MIFWEDLKFALREIGCKMLMQLYLATTSLVVLI